MRPLCALLLTCRACQVPCGRGSRRLAADQSGAVAEGSTGSRADAVSSRRPRAATSLGGASGTSSGPRYRHAECSSTLILRREHAFPSHKNADHRTLTPISSHLCIFGRCRYIASWTHSSDQYVINAFVTSTDASLVTRHHCIRGTSRFDHCLLTRARALPRDVRHLL